MIELKTLTSFRDESIWSENGASKLDFSSVSTGLNPNLGHFKYLNVKEILIKYYIYHRMDTMIY